MRKTRDQISEQFIRVMKRFEGQFINRVYDALQRQITDFTAKLLIMGSQAAKRQLDSIVIDTPIASVIQDIYTDIGIYSYGRTTRQINASAREQKDMGFGFNETLFRQILDYFTLYLLNKAVLPISQTTRDWILQVLLQGEREGWGVDKMARELEDSDFTMARARLIVRTELLKAMEFGATKAKEDSKWMTVSEWIAAKDHRTRHSHRYIDGTVVEEGEKFNVPIYRGNALIGWEKMRGPGDPNATAGNVCNCRCTLVTYAKRDQNGNLIPKKIGNSRISVILPNERFNPTTVITI